MNVTLTRSACEAAARNSYMLSGKHVGRHVMTWYVKSKTPDGEVVQILCDEPNQVIDNLNDQRKRARQVWVEGVDGKQIDEIFFTKMQGGHG